MRILYKFIGTQLLWPFLFGVAAFTSIFFAGQHLRDIAYYVLHGMSAVTALELVLLYLPSAIVFTLPMSCLVAVLVAFSRMSMESEIVALYASGISLYKAVIPVVGLGIVITGLSYGMSEHIVPGSARLSKELQARALNQKLTANEPFVFMDPGTGAIIYVGGGLVAANQTVTMKNVIVTKRTGNKPTLIVQAEEARWEKGWNWRLSNGTLREFFPDGSINTTQFRGLQTQEIELHEKPQDVLRRQRHPDEMSFQELSGHISSLRGSIEPKELRDLQVHLYNKLAIPLAALVFSFVAAPLAVSPRRGSPSVGIGLSILIIFAYWFVWNFTSALALDGNIPPVVGAFTADALGLILGLALLVKSTK